MVEWFSDKIELCNDDPIVRAPFAKKKSIEDLRR